MGPDWDCCSYADCCSQCFDTPGGGLADFADFAAAVVVAVAAAGDNCHTVLDSVVLVLGRYSATAESESWN